MKKLNFLFFVGIAAMAFSISACLKNEGTINPPQGPSFSSLKLTKASNSFLDKDYDAILGNQIRFELAPQFNDSTDYVFDYVLSNADVVLFNDDTLSYGDTVTLEKTNSFTLINTMSNESVKYPFSVICTDHKAALTKVFVEKVADTTIMLNYNIDEITQDLKLALPADIKGAKVVVKLEATFADVIKVDGVEYKDSLIYDTTFPCEIEVSDTVLNTKTTYRLSVLNGSVSMDWAALTTYKDNIADSYVRLVVDKVLGDPYFTYQAYDGKYAAVSKYNTKTSQVDSIGTRRINDARLDGASQFSVSDLALDVENGKVILFAIDKQFGSTGSVYSYANGQWNLLGNGGEIAKISGNSYYKAAIIYDPKTFNPIVAMTANAVVSETGLAKRGAGISTWDGIQWAANIPLSARAASDGYAYTPRMTRTADAVYLMYANQQLGNSSVYKYSNNAWSCIIDKDLPGPSVTLFQSDLKADSKGNVYAAYSDNNSGQYFCAIYKIEGDKFKKMGNYLPGVGFDVRADQFTLAFDGNDNPVLVFLDSDDDNKIKMATLDLATKAWGPIFNTGVSANSYYVSADNDKNGNVYVAFTQEDSDGEDVIVLWKGTTKK